MNPATTASQTMSPQQELICTTALCHSPAVAFVSWRTQPQPLPFCRTCADRLAAHGDTVIPLPTSGSQADRVA